MQQTRLPERETRAHQKDQKGSSPQILAKSGCPRPSGKGSPRSSPEEPEEREEACAQEPEPANAHQSAGAEESQPSSKASTPREESAHPSGSCSARSSELPGEARAGARRASRAQQSAQSQQRQQSRQSVQKQHGNPRERQY